MEVGTEISQKIRSAIKAKLMEIGSYVDDELPDYIMVMVANKKTQKQMASDLSLFLGSNTDVFTSWLHGLLVKLQTLSSDSGADSIGKPDKSKSSKERKKDKKKEGGEGKTKSKKEKRKVSKLNADGDAPKAKSAKTTTNETAADNQLETNVASISHKSKGTDEPENTSTTKQKETEEESKSDDVEDVRQLLVTETSTDELAKELENSEATIESNFAKTKTSVIVKSKPREVISTTNDAQSSSKSKRKCPSSVVTAVRKDESDEEAPPALASVVKVTGKKSAFPQSMQANSEMDSPTEANDETPDILCPPDASTTTNISTALSERGAVDLDLIKEAMSDVLTKWYNAEDEIGAFCRSLEKMLRKMSMGNAAITKLKIQKILFDYEMSKHRRQLPPSVSTSSNSNNAQVTEPSAGGHSRSSSCSEQDISKSAPAVNSNITQSENGTISQVPHTSGESPNISRSHSTEGKDTACPKSKLDSSKRDNSGERAPRLNTGDDRHNKRVGSVVKARSPTFQQSPPHHRHSSPRYEVSGISLNRNNQFSTSTVVSSTVVAVESTGPDARLSSDRQSHLRPLRLPSPKPPSNIVIHSGASTSTADVANHHHHQGNSILIGSLHSKRRPRTNNQESPSVLRGSLSRDPVSIASRNSPLLSLSQFAGGGEGTPDSSREISQEQLKVLAKNLKITVVNKRATKGQGVNGSKSNSNSEDSSSEDDSEEDSDSDSVDSDDDVLKEKRMKKRRLDDGASPSTASVKDSTLS